MKNISNHALLVLTPHTRNHANLLRAAKGILAKNGQLSVLYVMPKIPAVAYHVAEIALYAQMQADIGNGVLEELGESLQLPAERLILRTGPVKYITKHTAKEINAKLVIADLASWREQEASGFINSTINNLWQQLLNWSKELDPALRIETNPHSTVQVKH